MRYITCNVVALESSNLPSNRSRQAHHDIQFNDVSFSIEEIKFPFSTCLSIQHLKYLMKFFFRQKFVSSTSSGKLLFHQERRMIFLMKFEIPFSSFCSVTVTILAELSLGSARQQRVEENLEKCLWLCNCNRNNGCTRWWTQNSSSRTLRLPCSKFHHYSDGCFITVEELSSFVSSIWSWFHVYLNE